MQAPSPAPQSRPIRSQTGKTPWPTRVHIDSIIHGPPNPTAMPTPNFWVKEEGVTIATNTGVAATGLLMLLFWRIFLKRRSSVVDDIQRAEDASTAKCVVDESLRESFLNCDDRSELSLQDPKSIQNANGMMVEEASSLASRATMPQAGIFCVAMLLRASFIMFGLVSYWEVVSLKGNLSNEGSDHVITKFDQTFYHGSFWGNVKNFWNGHSEILSLLMIFTGYVQPFTQMVVACGIYFAPLTRFNRHRMILMQELTCKVPLSAFYVQGFLLITYYFTLGFKYKELKASAEIEINGFIGLVFFMAGQLAFIYIVNFLRLMHRGQRQEMRVTVRSESDRSEYGNDEESRGGARTSNHVNPLLPHSTLTKYGPSPDRLKSRRALVVMLSASLIVAMAFALPIDCLEIRYTDFLAPYMAIDGGSAHGNEVTISVSLLDMISKMYTSMRPRSFSFFYALMMGIMVVLNPLLLAVLATVEACITNAASRQAICEFVELLQCWCGGESMTIALLFLVPNVELISRFTFDDSAGCVQFAKVMHEECFLMVGRILPGGLIALLSTAVLSIAVSRLCVTQLYRSNEQSPVRSD